jgi:hypothetical protein
LATLHGIEEAPASMIVEMNTAQEVEQPRHEFGCMGIVLGFMVASLLVFLLFGYPHYYTSHAWLFWIVTAGLLLANSFVIYLAKFVSEAVNHEGENSRKR